jgi:hypothetical protein
MKKLSDEQLKRYVSAQDAKLVKAHIVVDEMHRKNLQAWIPYDLWIKVRDRVASENTSMNKYIEQALATYLLLEDEDIERIVARHA